MRILIFLKYDNDGVVMVSPCLVFIIGMFFSVFCVAKQNTIYVSPTGGIVEFEGGKVETTELHKAFEAAKPGTLIQLTPGIYTGPHHIKLQATEAKPLVIRGLNEKTLYDGKLKPDDEGYCLAMMGAAWIRIENVSFKNCWAAPIVVENSSYLTFDHLYAEDSRFMIFAQGSKTHHLLIENSTWIQDPSGRLWDTIPWDESHHGTHSYYNGGMLSTRRILGSVVFRNNVIKNAFNGFRMVGEEKSSKVQNANVEVYNNYFENIRDNPIEPERDAHNWWIHHNRIKNAHGLYSFTKVGGGDWFVFHNIGWFDQKPGGPSNTGGKIFKFAKDGPYPSKKFYVFNNSWYSRSPLVGSGQSRGFTYWNNATYFVGQKVMSKKKDWHDSYVSDYNLSNLSFKGELSKFSQDKHSVVSDKKMFVDAENGDFRLSEKSAAIDAGRIIELNGWRSEYSGKAPDIGAYEGEELLPGPPFRFDDSSYQEAPRIVQVRAKKGNLQISFSVPINKEGSESISIHLANGSLVNIACTLNAYDLSCLLPHSIQINQIESVSMSRSIKGKNGLLVTLWAAPADLIKIKLY